MLESVGHYKILDRIGSGAMGELFRARDTRVGRTVALRIVAAGIAGDPSSLTAFLHDARAAAAVSHPNIAALYEVGEDSGGGVHYLACEFVQGQKLKSLIAGRPLNPRRAIDLTVQIADALADGFASDIAAGNLAADTIIVNPKGNAKIIDFGLARWTSAGAAGAAPAPERDIAALGLVLYEMLTGKPLQKGAAAVALDPHLPKELEAIVQRTQSADVAGQYQGAATLAADLRAAAAILEARGTAATDAAVRPPKAARRRGAIVWLAAFAAMAALAWLLWTVSKMN